MPRRVTIAVGAGVWVGALAGLMTALADFGAHWLFMESAGDRLTLLARLTAFQPAVGAALGCVGGLWVGLGTSLLTGQSDETNPAAGRGRLALWCSLPLLPALFVVARLVWSGGKMSRLPGHALWIGLSFLLLAALTLGALMALQWLWPSLVRGSSRRAQALLGAIALFGFVCSKLNQHVLPNLYDYLHAVLSVLALASWALVLAAAAARWLPPSPGWLAAGSVLLLPLGAAAALGLSALDDNQNVRVALLSPNLPHSRSLLLGLGPLLPRVDAKSAVQAQLLAAAARRHRAEHAQTTDLPISDGAHVLLITVDALRADRLGVSGNTRGLTPELDALARRGVLFERAYAQAPHSSYSLCSLMTSEYLHETLEIGQPAPTDTLATTLAQAGYHTAAFYTQGIFHTAGEQLESYRKSAFGFALHDHQDRPAEQTTDRVLAEMDRTLGRGEPSALFWVHYFDVHEPYEATTLGTSDSDRYDSEILATDRAIGRLVREATLRLHKPLIVVITADHGEEFHDHGGVYHGSTLYDEQVRVPLIVVAPVLPPARVALPVESIDIAPTLLGLLGLAEPASMRGRDLRALALGRAAPRGPVFSAVIHKKMVVSWPYKLVADLRFGLFELYDLVRDPQERDNRADRDPARLATLRGEVYAWLDSLAHSDAELSASARALEWGRLGDRRAVTPLGALLLDEAAPGGERSEAARLLGKLADPLATPSLLTATRSPDRWVAAEAAIALGRLFDPRAAPSLRRLVVAEDPALRSRAAVSLGRLRDPSAVPALIDALWSAPNDYEREEAVRWLGRLGDARALDPLINLLPEPHVRHLVVIALGELGDARAFDPLLDVLTWDRNTNVRDGVVRGLAVLGDPRALPLLEPLIAADPALRNTGEALVRLRALERHTLGGADLVRGSGLRGFGRCHVGPLKHDWDFQHRTTCTTNAAEAGFRVHVPPEIAAAPQGSLVTFSVRRSDSVQAANLGLALGDRALSAQPVDGGWAELRWPLPARALRSGELRVSLHSSDRAARWEVDHLLIVPQAARPTPGG